MVAFLDAWEVSMSVGALATMSFDEGNRTFVDVGKVGTESCDGF